MTTPNSPNPWHQEMDELQRKNTQLQRELRFANGLIAALLLVVFWGYWHNPAPSSAVHSPASAAQPSQQGNRPAPPPRRAQQTFPTINTVTPRRPRVPTLLKEPKPREPRKTRRDQGDMLSHTHHHHPPRSQKPRRRRRLRPRRLPIQRRRRNRRSAHRHARFGDPLSPEDAPARWCRPGYVYSYFFPCLKRRGKKCLLRSQRKRYTCIPKRWWLLRKRRQR